MRHTWDRFKEWALDNPMLRVSTGFLAIEGVFEGIAITAACISYFVAGNIPLGILFAIWALWEVFARYFVIKQVV